MEKNSGYRCIDSNDSNHDHDTYVYVYVRISIYILGSRGPRNAGCGYDIGMEIYICILAGYV